MISPFISFYSYLFVYSLISSHSACPTDKLSLLVSKRFQELFTGSLTLLFHLSLTVLVHYR